MEQGRYAEAIASLEGSQRLRSSTRTLTRLGQAHFDAHQLVKAERILKRAGRNPEAMLLLGTLYQQRANTAGARRVYKAFLTYHADHKRAGWVRTMLKNL